MLDWFRRALVPRGTIDSADLDLLTVTDEPAEALRCVLDRFAARRDGQ
jgi:hypothetical protein